MGVPSNAGFTLLELLVVIALMAMVAGFAMPAFNSIGQARGVTESAFQMASLVEQARAEAVARKTYVWLGFQPVTNSGSLDLRVGLLGSIDGSTDTSSDNLALLRKPSTLERVALDPDAGLGEAPLSAASFTAVQTLTFTPTGEVLTELQPAPTDGFVEEVPLVLKQTRGTTAVDNKATTNVIDGSTGLSTILR